MSSFKNLNLISPILKALDEEGYSNPTSIQEQAIPIILKGKDLLGCAQTGTGKTAAFALPVLQILYNKYHGASDNKKIKALILTPTRELAIQIGDSFKAYGKNTRIKHAVIYGGVNQNPQTAELEKGVDILIATPGRLRDLINQGFIRLNHIELFVLDEADRMLDMGFIQEIKRLLLMLPANKQSLFFSATLSPEIKVLASSILKDPEKVEVTPVSSAAETVNQTVYFVEKIDKRKLLLHLLKEQSISAALVFTRTKHGADRVSKDLKRAGIYADSIHGDKSQFARQRALNDFKENKIKVLVATDIAARGIDIDKLSHVINFDLPNEPATYVHRIGRTGRAGESGNALSFCDIEERAYLKQINKLIAQNITIVEEHPFVSNEPVGVAVKVESPVKKLVKKSPSNSKGNWMKKKRINRGKKGPKKH